MSLQRLDWTRGEQAAGSEHIYPSNHPSMHPIIYLCNHPIIYPSIYASNHLSIYVSIHPSNDPCTRLASDAILLLVHGINSIIEPSSINTPSVLVVNYPNLPYLAATTIRTVSTLIPVDQTNLIKQVSI